MKLLTAAQMQALDRSAIETAGIPGGQLMEAAGLAVVDAIDRHFIDRFPGPVWVLCGHGNNGGDGFVIARELLARGWRVRTLLLAEPEAVGGEAAVNLKRLCDLRGDLRICPDEERLRAALAAGIPALAVDALLGTGLSATVAEPFAGAIDWLNTGPFPTVAVDLPSGVDASTGRILGRAVRAALTVTFAAVKPGLVSYPGAAQTGQLEIADIGIPARLLDAASGDYRLVTAAEARTLLPPRPAAGHKGNFGHLLVLAGSRGKTGAAALVAEAGLRGGAGLVTLACPETVWDLLAVKLTEVMTEGLTAAAGSFAAAASEQLRRLWPGKQALAVGPGLGTDDATGELLGNLLRECPLPTLLDADALNLLARQPQLLSQRACVEPVLTPHPGEMARLTGMTAESVQADRITVARNFATHHGVVLVLKGARTIIADACGRVYVNDSGNPALATAGSGDVLTGLIAALLAQGLAPVKAAVLGVYLHGRAADRIALRQGESGLLATDLLPELPLVRYRLQQGENLC